MSTIDFYLKDKIDEKLNTYLPLGGGVMTGRLSTQNNIGKNVDTGTLGLYGGSGDYTSGAYVELRGKTNSTNPGMFSIGANNGTDINILIGKPNGTLTWGGNKVLTDGTVGTIISANGTATSIVSGTIYKVAEVSLSAGVWIVIGYVTFRDMSGSGYNRIGINNTSIFVDYIESSVNSTDSHVKLETTRFLTLSATTNYGLYVQCENSGRYTDMSYIKAMRIA